MSAPVRARMAPSPTGRFHVGNVRTALYNWLFARHHSGTFILRIEDTDQARSSDASTAETLEAFRWLGLDWDEGPEVGGDYGPYFQSQRLERYRDTAQRLLDEGKAYPCYCTPDELDQRRQETQRQGLPPRYDRRCRTLSRGERDRLDAEGKPKALRFALPDEGAVSWDDAVRGHVSFESAVLDDFVLVKSDGFPSYLLACVVDDAAMAISHVIRGEDLLPSTPRQLHIYQALDLPAPVFAHLPLILGPDRAKLGKRHGPVAALDYRDQGYLPDALVNFIALLGWSTGDDREVLTREELISEFSLNGIGKSGAVFDIEKLNWMNGLYLRQLDPDQYIARARPFLEAAGIDLSGFHSENVNHALLLEQERAKTLAEIPHLTEFFFREPTSYDEKGERKWFRREGAADILTAVAAALGALEGFDAAAIEQAVRAVGEQAGKVGPVIHTTRLALTGRTVGPGLFELIEVLGKDQALTRLEAALAHVRSL